jgi:hypothetical protein
MIYLSGFGSDKAKHAVNIMLCLRLANYWRNSHHNRVGVVDVNSRYPPRINFLNACPL